REQAETALKDDSRRAGRVTVTVSGFRQPPQGLTRQAESSPLVLRLRTQRLVELDGGTVPVQHRPFEAPAAVQQCQLRQVPQQHLASALSALLRRDVHVLEIKPLAAEPGGIVEEVDGIAHGVAVQLTDQGAGAGGGAEQAGANA